jgi:D-apionolactonase
MAHQPESLIKFGTIELPPAERQFSAGPLTLKVSDGAIRHLSWHGIEVVRGISCPIRDAKWATCASLLVDEHVAETQDEFEISQVRLVADSALRVTLIFKGNWDGIFSAAAEMSACRGFITNRAGFTLLHPLRDIVGTPMRVTHPDGSVASSHFPSLISPDQVAGEISGLHHSIGGIDTEIIFQGDVFEMEDQRNWSDASFKTYCRPLSLPRPYRLNAGEVQRQEICIRFRGMPARTVATATVPAPARLELNAGRENVPRLAVTIDDGTIPDIRVHKACHLLNSKILQLRVRPETARSVYESARALVAVSSAEIELEVMVPSIDDPRMALARVAAECKNSALTIARVLALPESYLRSYQPAGPWPAGPKPQDLGKYAREAFSGAQIGGGVLTYFAELNRCRPDTSWCDYILHGSTAITHAADDCSVIESLEGLSHIYRSGRALAQGRDYRLGLTAIGMRSNPYGSDVVGNNRQDRMVMAGADPRQRGLFAAAWAVGAMAATEGHNLVSLALSAFVGPFGALHRQDPWPQPLYQESGTNLVYPLFHVVRFLSEMGGTARLSLQTAGNGIFGVASREGSRIRLVLANLGAGVSRVRLPHEAEVRLLNVESFGFAIRDPEWLDASDAYQGSDVALAPLSVAFLTMPA